MAYPEAYPIPSLSGIQADDIIAVALSQTGYTEDSSGSVYGAEFGSPKAEWCAYFISWCAKHAGIPTSIIPITSWADGFNNIGTCHLASSGYVPKKGDIAVYSNGTTWYHVGLVVSWDSSKKVAHTIEGNLGGKVKQSQSNWFKSGVSVPVYQYITPDYGNETNTTITIKPVTNVSNMNAQINGTIQNSSGFTFSSCGFSIGTAKGSYFTTKTESINLSNNTITIWYDINKWYGNLLPGSTYYYKLFAKTGDTTYWSSESSFTTTGTAPTISINPVTNTSDTNAQINGAINNIYNIGFTACGFRIGTSSNSYITTKTEAINLSNTTINIWYDMNKWYGTLSPGTTYYYQFFAKYNDITIWSNESTFTTTGIKTFTVSFNSQGGNEIQNQAVEHDGTVIAPSNPTRTGYSFGGWYKEADCTNAWLFDKDKVTSDITLYAKWNVTPTYTVTYNGNGNTGGTAPVDSNSYTSGQTVTVQDVGTLVRAGYTFAGWNTAAGGEGTSISPGATFAITGNTTLYANWTQNPLPSPIVYTVTYDSQGGSAVESVNVNANSTIPVPGTPVLAGYTFKGWFKEPACINAWNFTSDTVTDNITLYANWSAQTPSAYLSGITLSAGSLKPSFKKTVTSYTVNLKEGDKSVTVTPVKAYDKATMTINGAKVKSKTVTVANGKSTTLTVKVTCGRTSKTYKLTIKRAKSTNNRLAALKISVGDLSPAFNEAITSYNLKLPKGTSRVTITAVKASSLAKVTPAKKTYTLKNGQTIKATIKVKAQSGATKTYTITITRER